MPRNSVSDYTTRLFQDSIITGVPQIVQTVNLPRKILKIVVLLAFIIGFIYQATEYMQLYYSYPTVMDIDVKYPDEIESPAITFCNLNGIKRSAFCTEYPEACTEPDDAKRFCDVFPHMCQHSENTTPYLKVPHDDGLDFEVYSSREELRKLGHERHKTLPHCIWRKLHNYTYENCNWENYIHMDMHTLHTGYRNCFVLFSNINSSQLSKFKIPVIKGIEPLYHMGFDMESQEYFRPDREIGVIMAIHSPNRIINPFLDGFVIRPGYMYTVHIKVVQEQLLPYPYDTKCKDYIAEWRSRGNKGPLSQTMCISECTFNQSIAQADCVGRRLEYPHDKQLCDDEQLEKLHIDVSACFRACPQDCVFTVFDYDVNERKLENEEAREIKDFYNRDDMTANRAAVLLFLNRPEIVVYSHRPQYESIEVFSSIGGYVGMWLGISLVAVWDFLESIILITNYAIRRRLRSDSK